MRVPTPSGTMMIKAAPTKSPAPNMFVNLINFWDMVQNSGKSPIAVVETNIAKDSQNTSEIPTLI